MEKEVSRRRAFDHQLELKIDLMRRYIKTELE
jgi:hypothetical protein